MVMYILLQKIKESFLSEQDRWFLWSPVLFALGIGLYFSLSFEPSMWWTLGVIELLILLAIWWRLQLQKLFILLILGIIVLGFANVQLKAIYLSKQYMPIKEQKIYLSGQIVSMGHNSRGNQRIVLEDVKDWDGKKLGNIQVSLSVQKSDIKIGDCVEMVAKIRPLPNAVVVGGFQFNRKAFFEGLSAMGYAESRALPIECSTKTLGVLAKLGADLRQKITKRVDAVLPPDEAAITNAILAGIRGGIGKKLTQNYRDSGLAHFLSISGLHMSMLAGLMFFFIRFGVALVPFVAKRYDSKKIAAVFAIFLSATYLLISGAEIPAQRAFIMTFIVLLGVLFSRRAISMQMLSWAAIFVLLFSPQSLIGPSFQMSFAAVVALIAFYEKYASPLHKFLSGDKKTLRIILMYIVGILVSDLVASLATLPFAIYHFNRIALYTTLANFLAGPIIGLVIMPFVLLSMLLMPLGLEVWSLKIVGFGVGLVNDITSFVSSLSHAGYPVVSMPFWGLMLIVFGGLWLCLWNFPWRKWGAWGILVGFLSIFTVSTPDIIIDEDAKAVALKTEQGDLLILPSRGNYFDKKIWLEKNAEPKLSDKYKKKLKKIYEGKELDKSWLDLECDEEKCVYKNQVTVLKKGGLLLQDKALDTKSVLGASISLPNQIQTIRQDIGQRFWNTSPR